MQTHCTMIWDITPQYYTKAHIHLPLLIVVPGLSVTLEILCPFNNKEKRSRVALFIPEFRTARIWLSQQYTNNFSLAFAVGIKSMYVVVTKREFHSTQEQRVQPSPVKVFVTFCSYTQSGLPSHLSAFAHIASPICPAEPLFDTFAQRCVLQTLQPTHVVPSVVMP